MATFGEKVSPILVEIEETTWEFDSHCNDQPHYPEEAFRAAAKIFMHVLMDKMYSLQNEEKIQFENRCEMANKAGEDVRNLIKIYTGIDSFDFYKKQ